MHRLLALAAALFTLGIGCLTQAQFFVPGPALWAPASGTCSQKWSATQINSGLSGGGTTTVTQGGTAQDANVFASLSHTSGKYYSEFNYSGIALDGNTAFGIGNTSSAVTTGLYLGEGEDTLGFFIGGTVKLWSNNVAVLNYTAITPAVTDRFALALDLTDNLIWVKDVTTATSWYGSSASSAGDPVAGTNGFSLTQTGMTITAHPVTFADTLFTASSTGTGDFASTSWVGTAPSGYSAMCS